MRLSMCQSLRLCDVYIDEINSNLYSVSLCFSEGPITPQGTGFLAVQSVSGVKVSVYLETEDC